MNKKVGFIGCGKMAQAMIEGVLRSEIVNPKNMIASASTQQTIDAVKNKFQINVTLQNKEVAVDSDFLILAVKPNLYPNVIEEIKDVLKDDCIIVTVAAGITLSFIEQAFSKRVKAVRTMPNTPSLVGEGMSVICANDAVTVKDLKEVVVLFESFGRTEILDESLMDAVPAISGSSPAYVYMFIEALADGGVRQGIPRDKAYRLASQAILGAAKMVLETGMHPGALKDNVCTPGGATIEAVATLEKHNFRAGIIAAMESCTNKSKALSKQ